MTNEFFTEAVVLDKEPVGEADSQVTFYTKDFGKITARATSGRKIISKLASHLEPLNFVQVRLVQKNRFQIADALRTGTLSAGAESISILQLVKDLAAEGQPDPELWNLLKSGQVTGRGALRLLGFDGRFAVCGNCGRPDPGHFLVRELEYFCGSCFLKFGKPASFALK